MSTERESLNEYCAEGGGGGAGGCPHLCVAAVYIVRRPLAFPRQSVGAGSPSVAVPTGARIPPATTNRRPVFEEEW